MASDTAALADLAAFARIELASGDLEPWAEVLRVLRPTLGAETTAWLVKLYNAYDDLGSAVAVWRRWPGPLEWSKAADGAGAAEYPLTGERRNLRGGKVCRHLADYAAHVGEGEQVAWLADALGPDPMLNFGLACAHMRTVWGVGRQTAYEWAEFAGKALGLPVAAPDAMLWESEGPRRSLCRLYGIDRPTRVRLDDAAEECRAYLAAEGAPLEWWDFETVICDFHVQRAGRYYPGRHLAALRQEISEMGPADAEMVAAAFRQVIPQPWASIAPGIDRKKLSVYRDTGRMVTEP